MSTESLPVCNHCGKPIELRDRKLPPWCLACGADLKSFVAQAASPPAAALSEQVAPGPASADEHQWRDRFGTHNVAIGILFFVWGTAVSTGSPQSGGDKVLAAHKQLKSVVDAMQVVTLLSGIALVVSGVALRNGRRWGYPLAVACALVLIAAGAIFLAGFQHLAGGQSLEHGVARLSFIRHNLDMLIGLVDGLGLLWFLSTRVSAGSTSSVNA